MSKHHGDAQRFGQVGDKLVIVPGSSVCCGAGFLQVNEDRSGGPDTVLKIGTRITLVGLEEIDRQKHGLRHACASAVYHGGNSLIFDALPEREVALDQLTIGIEVIVEALPRAVAHLELVAA
jgi:hypothetical protein